MYNQGIKEQEHTMNILIVGNGFDLAHGLPTKYGDFLRYIRELHKFWENPGAYSDKEYGAYFSSLRDDRNEVFDELTRITENNSWLKLFDVIFEERAKKGKDSWIDFEKEISYVIQALDDARLRRIQSVITESQQKTAITGLNSGVVRILFDILNDQHQKKFGGESPYKMDDVSVHIIEKTRKILYSDLNRLTRSLELYLVDYVASKPCMPLDEIAELDIDYLLSFNYTNTYCRVYGKNEMEETDEVDFIHGKVKEFGNVKNCNLVLGIDEYQDNESRDRDNEFIQFKKFYQRIFKGTGCHYTDWLSDFEEYPLADDLNIYIYGHSLDVTDKDILNRIIMTEGAVTTIFYHSQEALGNYIANLVKIIGEQTLIEMTDGRNSRIVFKRQSSYKD